MDLALLALLVVASAAAWPLNRWALRHGATPVGIGIVLSVVTLAAGIVGSAVSHQPLYHPAAFFFGALGGIAFGAGFVLIILRCLAMGPMGPTATAYSLGLAGTVLATLLVPYALRPSVAVYAGFAATLVVVVLLGLVRAEQTPSAVASGAQPRDWQRLVVAGWGFSALYGATQILAGRFAPQAPFGFLAAQALVSLLLLLIVASSGRVGWPRAPDIVAGAGTGIIMAALVPVSTTAMGGTEAAPHFYPISVAAPPALAILLGALAYRERLTVWGWIACALGIGALVLLGLPRV